jgi:nitrate reductase NapE component
MTTSATKGGKKKQEVPLWAVIVSGLCLMGFMGWLYQFHFGPRPAAPLSKEEKDNRAIVAEVVKSTGGDIKKVSEAERERLYKIAGPYWGIVYSDVKKKDLKME